MKPLCEPGFWRACSGKVCSCTRDTWQQTRQGLAQRGQELDWQNEAARLIQLYDRLGCCKAR